MQKDGSTQDETETTNDGDTEGGTPSVAPKAITARGFPKPISEMTPEEKAQADDIDLRCLSLCIGMLERVNGVGFFSS
jgi:condensin complex subunit 3